MSQSLGVLLSLRLSMLLCTFALVISCRNASEAKVKNVFGDDDRQPLLVDEFPWRTIGRVVAPDTAICTGTLVARDLVLTAAHCVIDKNTKRVKDGTFFFQPNFRNGSASISEKIVWVWWGTDDPSKFRGKDWAILRTASPIGDNYGWLGTKLTNVMNFFDQMTIVGYSEDFFGGQTAGIHHNCNKMGIDAQENYILSDCDTAPGSSGGPVLRMLDGNLTIVGISVAERRNGAEITLKLPQYDVAHANVAIPSADFTPKLLSILAGQ